MELGCLLPTPRLLVIGAFLVVEALMVLSSLEALVEVPFRLRPAEAACQSFLLVAKVPLAFRSSDWP